MAGHIQSTPEPTAGNPEAGQRQVFLQTVLETLRERQFKQPVSYYPRFRVSDGELDLLAATLRDADREANYPVKLVIGKDPGDHWHLAYGYTEGRPAGAPAGEVHVTTDYVHCSELRGDALDDARAYVTLRNNTPSILACLEELLQHRLGARS